MWSWRPSRASISRLEGSLPWPWLVASLVDVALRPVDATRCEAKRLYVRPKFRGYGVGKALLEWLIAEGRAAGYIEMVGDTMPVMERAIGMYEQMGFERNRSLRPTVHARGHLH
jgi:GNAT superfamily N-acetyltransferase